MEFIKSEDELLQYIINIDGNCVCTSTCRYCPFIDKCITIAITKERKLLPKETRVRLAYEKLFNKLMENELDS